MISRKRSSDCIGESETDVKKTKESTELADPLNNGTEKSANDKPELYHTISGHGCLKGERLEMEDTFISKPKFELQTETQFLKRCSFFAIFDGHAGVRAADYCEKNMDKCMKEHASKYNDFKSLCSNMKTIYLNTYKQVNDDFTNIAKQTTPIWKDGTTATTMIIVNNIVYVANVGDTQVVVARKCKDDSKYKPFCLTTEHNPKLHSERMRIQTTGATVKDGRVNGVIEVSRSIGDISFKKFGVISTPDLKRLTITEDDEFAIIGCDGLWKSFTHIDAINYVAEKMQELKKVDLTQSVGESREECELRCVAEKLAAEAVRRECKDNVSVIIIKMEHIKDI